MRRFLAILMSVFVFAAAGNADEINLKKPSWLGGSFDYALDGYDTVAYFTEGKPVEGKESISTEYKGATWLFASEDNKAMFLADPEKYAPAYGGHCAWAAGVRKVAPGSPKVWKIVDGRLYLNYDESIQEKWEKDIPGFIEVADEYWPNREDY